MGNITGAMVFQSAIPTSIGLVFAPALWSVIGAGVAFSSAAITLAGAGLVFVPLLVRRPARRRPPARRGGLLRGLRGGWSWRHWPG